MLYHDFDRVGKDLFAHSLNNGYSGNLSVRQGNRIVVTASGAALHRLGFGDLVEIGLFGEERGRASTESVVHRGIYRATDSAAVAHAHPPFAVAISEHHDSIVPEDAEGSYYFRVIPVVRTSFSVGSAEVAALVPQAMLEWGTPLVIVRGHGVFSAGRNLPEAYKWISSFESSCRHIFLSTFYGKLYKEL